MKSYHDIPTDGGSDVAGQVEEHVRRLSERMSAVKSILAVMSGKGGVGKSSLTVQLAGAMARTGLKVGILDADVGGSSITALLGVRRERVKVDSEGAHPIKGPAGVKVMAIDLLLRDDSAPVRWQSTAEGGGYAWRGLMEMAAIREMLTDTAWGPLDVLVIDLPPGIDRLPDLVELLPRLDGAVIVTIPSDLSELVVGRSIRAARSMLRTEVLGIIENMASYVCPNCGAEEPLFFGDAATRLAESFEVPFLGRIPFDPGLAGQRGEGVFDFTSVTLRRAIDEAAARVIDMIMRPEATT